MSGENQISVVVLAAGKGTRMKSDLSKVLFPICGRPMLHYVLDAAASVSPSMIAVVVGHQGEAVRQSVQTSWREGKGCIVEFPLQEAQKGTAHAVMSAKSLFTQDNLRRGHTLILCGDVPLLSGTVLQDFTRQHLSRKAGLSLMTFEAEDPGMYGRIIRDSRGNVVRIVEARDLGDQDKDVKELNAGIYLVQTALLFDLIERVGNNNAKGEYYLTDIVEIAANQGVSILAYECLEEMVQGINDRYALSVAERVKRREILKALALSGVTIGDPDRVYVDYGVKVGKDCRLEPSTHLRGQTVIHPGCIIGPETLIEDSEIGADSSVCFSVVERSKTGSRVKLGPYTHIRPGCVIGDGVSVGNYAEVKNSVVGAGSKIHHHSYIGDCSMGERVNIGAGTVTVNYDGRDKHRTVIGDDAFIGCNANLIAPVKVGKRAYVAAGSTITDDVPDESLALARERQVVKEGWARKKQQEWDLRR